MQRAINHKQKCTHMLNNNARPNKQHLPSLDCHWLAGLPPRQP